MTVKTAATGNTFDDNEGGGISGRLVIDGFGCARARLRAGDENDWLAVLTGREAVKIKIKIANGRNGEMRGENFFRQANLFSAPTHDDQL